MMYPISIGGVTKKAMSTWPGDGKKISKTSKQIIKSKLKEVIALAAPHNKQIK